MGLPAVSAGRRRRWLVRLVAVGLGRGLLLAALALATRGWLMSGTSSIAPSIAPETASAHPLSVDPPPIQSSAGLNEGLAVAPWPFWALLAIFLTGLAVLAALRHRQVVDAEAWHSTTSRTCDCVCSIACPARTPMWVRGAAGARS
jgi:hypothetical protein